MLKISRIDEFKKAESVLTRFYKLFLKIILDVQNNKVNEEVKLFAANSSVTFVMDNDSFYEANNDRVNLEGSFTKGSVNRLSQ